MTFDEYRGLVEKHFPIGPYGILADGPNGFTFRQPGSGRVVSCQREGDQFTESFIEWPHPLPVMPGAAEPRTMTIKEYSDWRRDVAAPLGEE